MYICTYILLLSSHRMELANKNVIYVGGFGGIGFESCKCFLQQGIAKLFIFDVKEDASKLAELRLVNDKVYFHQLDLVDRLAIQDAFKVAFEQLKRIDILVNGSGIMNEQQIERTLDINLQGPILCSLTALQFMDKSKGGPGGIIANISSVVGLDPYGSYAVYTATKHGLNGFSRALAEYYPETKVSIITICPSTTETPMLQALRIDPVTTFPKMAHFPKSLDNNQTASECASNLVETIKGAKNGSFWMLAKGESREFIYPKIEI